MRLRKFTILIWTLLLTLSALVFWKIVLLGWSRWDWNSHSVNSTLIELLKFTLAPNYTVPEALALAIAIGYVLRRKRESGADEIDVAITVLALADLGATLMLFGVGRAIRLL